MGEGIDAIMYWKHVAELTDQVGLGKDSGTGASILSGTLGGHRAINIFSGCYCREFQPNSVHVLKLP